MNEKKKKPYVAPKVKFADCCIELGYSGSSMGIMGGITEQIQHIEQDMQLESWIEDEHSDISNCFGETF